MDGNESARRAESAISADQVGVGTGAGRPPGTGTGPRSHHRDSEVATGRVDAEVAVFGVDTGIPGAVPSGAPESNVGGVQGTTGR